jgi:hypothetical protein
VAKPSFKALWANYPHDGYDALFQSIGWQAFAHQPGWENTCAIRVSICLARSGVTISSRANMRALTGPIRGKLIEPKQDALSKTLKAIWGDPVALRPRDGLSAIAGRDGVVSFFAIAGYNVGGRLGGHIDLIDGTLSEQRDPSGRITARRATYEIAHGDYMNSAESIWFWEMPA